MRAEHVSVDYVSNTCMTLARTRPMRECLDGHSSLPPETTKRKSRAVPSTYAVWWLSSVTPVLCDRRMPSIPTEREKPGSEVLSRVGGVGEGAALC
jgi:hypothetical protein